MIWCGETVSKARSSALTTCVIIVLHPSDSRRAYLCWSNCAIAINIALGLTGDAIACGLQATYRQRAIFGLFLATVKNEMHLVNIEPSTSSGTMKWSQLTNWGTAGNFIINGSKSISLEQPSPRQVGFDTIDAILPGPMYGKGADLFSWEKYALVYFELGMLLGGFFSLILGRVNNMNTRSSLQSGHHWTKLFSWLWIWFSFILRTRIKFSRDYYVFILGPVYCPQTLYVKECADHQ